MPSGVLAFAPRWDKQYKSIDEAPALLLVEEASIFFRLPIDTVRRMCKEKSFVAYKVGREWRIDKEKTLAKLGGN